jgi:Histidine kinase
VRRERTCEPTRLVAELAARYGGEVPGLTVTRPTLESPRAAPDRRHAWETGTLRWDAFYVVVFVAVFAVVLVSTPGSTVVAGAAVAVMVPWYLVAGRPLWSRRGSGQVRAAVYVTGMFAAFGVAQSQNPYVWFLAFAITPQFYMFLDTRLAIGLGVGLNFLAAALLVSQYPTGSTAAVAFGIAACGGGFSVFFGAWVTRIIRQSADRAEIIDQLEATRAELATAQHEAGRLAERQRLAADIHDTLAQGFASIRDQERPVHQFCVDAARLSPRSAASATAGAVSQGVESRMPGSPSLRKPHRILAARNSDAEKFCLIPRITVGVLRGEFHVQRERAMQN